MNIILIGAGLIVSGVIVMASGIMIELSKCVMPQEGRFGVTFDKRNFDEYAPGFMHGFKSEDGKEFAAWGLYKKEVKR